MACKRICSLTVTSYGLEKGRDSFLSLTLVSCSDSADSGKLSRGNIVTVLVDEGGREQGDARTSI